MYENQGNISLRQSQQAFGFVRPVSVGRPKSKSSLYLRQRTKIEMAGMGEGAWARETSTLTANTRGSRF